MDYTCVGHCAANHYCCTGNVSGCQRPSCVMGCAIANVTGSKSSCAAMCKAATGQWPARPHCVLPLCVFPSADRFQFWPCLTAGQCSFEIAKGFEIQMCGNCPQGCPGCDDADACSKGCELAFQARRLGAV